MAANANSKGGWCPEPSYLRSNLYHMTDVDFQIESYQWLREMRGGRFIRQARDHELRGNIAMAAMLRLRVERFNKKTRTSRNPSAGLSFLEMRENPHAWFHCSGWNW